MATSNHGPGCPFFLSLLEASVQTEQEICVLQEFYGYCLQKSAIFSRFLVLEDLADRAELARLKGRYVNVCPYALLSLAFMSILGGDRILAENNCGEGFLFDPTCKFVCIAVRLPRDDRDLGDHSPAFVPCAPDPGSGPDLFSAYAEPAFVAERDYSLEGVY